MRPLTLSLSPSGGEGIGTAPSPSERERVGVRVAYVFTHNPGWPRRGRRRGPGSSSRAGRERAAADHGFDLKAIGEFLGGDGSDCARVNRTWSRGGERRSALRVLDFKT